MMSLHRAWLLSGLSVLGWLALGAVRAEDVLPEKSVAVEQAPVEKLAVPPPLAKFAPTSAFRVERIEGWQVLVHESLFEQHADIGARALTHLRHHLYQIRHRLPSGAVDQLRQVKIWVEFQEPHHPCMCYHPDAGWLRDNGMNPEKAKCVEVANCETFLKWTIDQPWMVLHELAHAYHDQVLDNGFQNAPLKAAFERAQQAGNYAAVLRINGRKDRHYAATNPMEYFAEATEAYFGTNDFFPFVRAELAAHDPPMFELLGRLWGDIPPAKTP